MAMIFNLSSETVAKELNGYNGSAPRFLPAGWYTVRLSEISTPVTVDGIVKGYVTLEDVESGTSFRHYTTYKVTQTKDDWRVEKTQDFFARVCQVVGLTNPPQDWAALCQELIGSKFLAKLTTKETKRTDPETLQDVVYTNNELDRGKWTAIILPAKVEEPQNDNNGSEFNFSSASF